MTFVELAIAIRDGTAIAISAGHIRTIGRWKHGGSFPLQWRSTNGVDYTLHQERSELGGIYAMLVAITLLCALFDIDQESVR
jgi:hypothetical protein